MNITDGAHITDELENEIKKYKESTKLTYKNKDGVVDKDVFAKELELYFESGQKSKNVENLMLAFESIPATSVEAERAFSTLGLMLHKSRTRLTENVLENMRISRMNYFEAK